MGRAQGWDVGLATRDVGRAHGRDVGLATRDVGLATRDVGRAHGRDVGHATRDVGRATRREQPINKSNFLSEQGQHYLPSWGKERNNSGDVSQYELLTAIKDNCTK